MPTPAQRKVAISYAWKTEAGGDSAGKVMDFCQHLRGLDVQVLRDVDGMKLGDSISAFMREIGTADFLCVFLSDAYLRSPNCMYELLVAWESCRHTPDKFRQRVQVWVMPDAKTAYQPAGRLGWADYWKAERDRLAPLIKELSTDGLAAAELEAFNHVKKFANVVNEILCFVADTLGPRSVDELQAWATKEFPPLTPDEEKRQLEEVYQHTVAAVEGILKDFPKVSEFLALACPELISGSGSTARLSDKTRQQQLDGRVIFKAIHDKLAAFMGTPVEWVKLGEVGGGLAVLAVDRRWVLEQRRRWRQGEADFPGSEGVQLLHDERWANFLPVATAALAQGYVRLARVFGEPDPRLLKGPARVSRGLGPDLQREYKLYFIHAVLKPDKRGLKVDEKDGDAVDELFKDVQEALEVAAEEERDPFYGTEPALRALKPLVRKDMPLEHLLLLLPSGKGGIRDVVDEPVHIFSSLHRIFQTIQLRLLNA